ncbi:MAG: hypothetical protein NC204_03920 [Candidatus Amulumruptor caecigallinarius]|nr:hypothetical protein [Candidatus Amulumruptor caecigallinarius]
MKKTSIYFLSALTLGLGFTSCSSSDDGGPDETLTAKEQMLKDAASDYINLTVLPTYKGMADAAISLYDYCEVIQNNHANGTLTTADIKNAADAWKASRKYWELSEAFLFGPAADHYIDPHIDSWPLDKDAMDRMLADIRAGKEYSLDNNFGYGLLGFHSIEYMLFELTPDGNASNYHSLNYTPEELTYLLLVAEDLRNQCVCLEACWAGTENVSEKKQRILEESELDLGKNHGYMMINAGKGGSIYKTYQEVAEEIIQGCIDIADEVGNTKIGRPCTGSSLEDRNYIESPYSLNSIEDFIDNIKSIQNSYCGVAGAHASISDYVKSVNPDLDAKLKNQINQAITAIGAIREPFAKNANSAEARNAVKVVGTDLVEVLNEVYTSLSR